MTKEEKDDGPPFAAIAVGGGILVAVFVAVPEVARIYREHHAATPENLASVALDQTPQNLARALPASTEHRTTVDVDLRHGLAFETATFSWRDSPDRVSKISLHTAREEEEEESTGKKKKEGTNESPRSFASKLDDVLPGVSSSGTRQWGAVEFEAASDGDLSFSVKGSAANSQPNPLFARQVEAARQVLLEVAFDVPRTISSQELADTLGSGYSIKELASIDPAAPQADTVRALTSRLPAALEQNDGVRVPIAHAVVSSAALRWPFGSHFELSFRPRRSFKDRRAAFITCLETHAGTPALHDGSIAVVRLVPGDPLHVKGIQINVTEETVETFTYDAGADVPSFRSLIAAMDACNK